ncbi:hypothetical protein F4561_006337 [Lipingzhangella halophila]|uniref:Uncharacterized protein n=1 Tax=Lipingzhangella halophila TaxID=1783352 RepID=A0A7W7W652_9ACTN|nr:hypothetical protein [Lipingzhangella halophila]MBB4935443.1 hypothetical protein [Lipingzhangella halophila]
MHAGGQVEQFEFGGTLDLRFQPGLGPPGTGLQQCAAGGRTSDQQQ